MQRVFYGLQAVFVTLQLVGMIAAAGGVLLRVIAFCQQFVVCFEVLGVPNNALFEGFLFRGERGDGDYCVHGFGVWFLSCTCFGVSV